MALPSALAVALALAVPLGAAGCARPATAQPAGGAPSLAGLVRGPSTVDARGRRWGVERGVLVGREVADGAAPGRIHLALPLPRGAARWPGAVRALRVDVTRGAEGVAYLAVRAGRTRALYVIDLATGAAQRRLARHPRLAGVAALALSPDGELLCFGPRAHPRAAAVPTAALVDRAFSDAELAATLQDLAALPDGGAAACADGPPPSETGVITAEIAP